MSETLAKSIDHAVIENAAFPLHLELAVEDPDSIRELLKHAEGAERNDYALEALKIGIVALRQAAGAFDTEFITRETNRLLESLDQQLNGHVRQVQQRVADSLGNYFDPDSGKFSERVKSLTDDNGELARLLKTQIDGEDSRLARTMIHHVGESSPLMKLLSPEQSKGLLAALSGRLEEELTKQSEAILGQFDLNEDKSALKRLMDGIEAKHGDFTNAMKEKITEVQKDFDLKDDTSALSVLVTKVKLAQETITDEFKLDNETSALNKLKEHLGEILDDQVKRNAEFQEEVKVALGKLVTKRETEARGTQHGGNFQDAVFELVAREAQMRGELAEDTGNRTGRIKNCKVGDMVVEMHPESVAAGARIVVEAKEDASYTVPKAIEELDTARKNREAQIGIFVFSKSAAPAQIESLLRYGNDIVVVWDAEDPLTDSYLRAALEIARALCVRVRQTPNKKVDFSIVDRAILDIEKRVNNLDQIRTSAETIRSSSEKIIKRVDTDQSSLNKQLGLLRETLDDLKEIGQDSTSETVG